MGVIEDVYDDLEADISLGEFRDAVAAKVEHMGGLADDETAAMLVAHELDENRVVPIGDLDPEMTEAKFLAKVRQVGEHRTFEREEGDEGHVVNVEVADETGTVRLAFWDEHAKAIANDGLAPGTVLRVKGRPKEGYSGLEVSVDQVEPDAEAEIDIDPEASIPIDQLSVGQSGVQLHGKVLAVGSVRTFEREAEADGRVSNIAVGDESGRIRVTLWDEQAEIVDSVNVGDVVEITDGYIRERDDRLECHVGDRGEILQSDDDVTFCPTTTPISALSAGDEVDIAGVIRSTDGKRTFDRDDGTEGQVRNVRLQDKTGDVRVALWGDAADRDLAPGDTVWLGDVEVRDGWQDDIEVSVGWRSVIAPMDLDSVETIEPTPSVTANTEGSVQLDSFESERPASESVAFEGTVVQTGTPIIVDDGEEAVTIEGEADVILGQDVTVHGVRRGDTIEADQVEIHE